MSKKKLNQRKSPLPDGHELLSQIEDLPESTVKTLEGFGISYGMWLDDKKQEFVGFCYKFIANISRFGWVAYQGKADSDVRNWSCRSV